MNYYFYLPVIWFPLLKPCRKAGLVLYGLIKKKYFQFSTCGKDHDTYKTAKKIWTFYIELVLLVSRSTSRRAHSLIENRVLYVTWRHLFS